MQIYLQSHHAECLQSRHAESLLLQIHTHLLLQSVLPPQKFTCTSSKGLLSLSVIAMLLLADEKSFCHADDPQQCKQVVTMTIAIGCKCADLQAIPES